MATREGVSSCLSQVALARLHYCANSGSSSDVWMPANSMHLTCVRKPVIVKCKFPCAECNCSLLCRCCFGLCGRHWSLIAVVRLAQHIHDNNNNMTGSVYVCCVCALYACVRILLRICWAAFSDGLWYAFWRNVAPVVDVVAAPSQLTSIM